MKKRKKKKRIMIFLIGLFLVILITIIFYSKSYKTNYTINSFKVTEEYYKPLKQYIFKINVKNNIYEYTVKNNYRIRKKLIDGIIYKKGCVTPSSKLKLYTLCYDDNNYYIKGKTNSKLKKHYKKISYNDDLGNIYIWNHKGYTFLNKNKKINILKNEMYDNPKAYSFDKYIITPDYNKKHLFSKFYIINMENGKLNELDFPFKISFDFYYLGVNENKLYFVDKKNKLEYLLNLKKLRVELVSTKDNYGKIWQYGWKDISMVKLSFHNYSFKDKKIYNYKITNNKLYLSYNLCKNSIIIDDKVNKILKENADSIYYLKGNKVYLSSNIYQKSTVIKYDELFFNNKNQIFIF